MSRMMLLLLVLLFSASLSDASNATGHPSGSWKKCIGDEIAKCMSCVFEAGSELVEAVLAAAVDDEEETVEGILKTIGKAAECAVECRKASVKRVRSQCGTRDYCQTSFCLRCCGKGDWQCIGNDFVPQCAPKWTEMDVLRASAAKVEEKIEHMVEKVEDKIEEAAKTVMTGLAEKASNTMAAVTNFIEPMTNTSAEYEKCQCGPGSGNPDTCCSKCKPNPKDPHSVHHCPGGGKNTGPFCGNDFHVTEPEACWGDTPYCCTNCCGKPVCCRKDQRCHEALDSHCVDADDPIFHTLPAFV